MILSKHSESTEQSGWRERERERTAHILLTLNLPPQRVTPSWPLLITNLRYIYISSMPDRKHNRLGLRTTDTVSEATFRGVENYDSTTDKSRRACKISHFGRIWNITKTQRGSQPLFLTWRLKFNEMTRRVGCVSRLYSHTAILSSAGKIPVAACRWNDGPCLHE